jgi:hypothetical protein
MNWIDLAQDRDRWQVLVNAGMKLRVPQNAGNLKSCIVRAVNRFTVFTVTAAQYYEP